MAMEESLGSRLRTYEVFRELHETLPALASDCADVALKALVKAGDYRLVDHYLGDPEEILRECSYHLHTGIADFPTSQEPMEMVYADRVNLVITALVGIGKPHQAGAFWDAALAAIESPQVREGVRSKLAPRPEG
jgi:hypothetical protein